MKHIEVFKTNVHKKSSAQKVAKQIALLQPHCAVYFDIEDRDRVLIIESDSTIDANSVIALLQKHNVSCEILN
jgi:hypothetical protein